MEMVGLDMKKFERAKKISTGLAVIEYVVIESRTVAHSPFLGQRGPVAGYWGQ
jgi:hypothetical protein